MVKTAEARPAVGTIEARVNSGRWVDVLDYGQDADYETIRSDHGFSKPKAGWVHTDSNGHVHAFTDPLPNRTRLETPTLRTTSRHVECDGSCGGVCRGEGYSVTEYRCLICNEIVEPEYVPDGNEKAMLRGTWWSLRLGEVPDGVQRWMDLSMEGKPVGVEFRAMLPTQKEPAMYLFGFGYLSPIQVSADGPDIRTDAAEIIRAQLWPVA